MCRCSDATRHSRLRLRVAAALAACGGGRRATRSVEDVAARGARRRGLPRRRRQHARGPARRGDPHQRDRRRPRRAGLRARRQPLRLRRLHRRRGADHRRRGRHLRGAGPTAAGHRPLSRAKIESLETDAAFEARTTADDPDAAKAVYVSDIEFDKPGEWRLVGADPRRRPVSTRRACPPRSSTTTRRSPTSATRPRPSSTPTVDEVGDLAEIDTRDPHDTMHDVDARRRRRQEAHRPPLRDARAVRQPRLRPGRRRRRAGQVRAGRRGRLHPHGGLRRQQPQQRHAPPAPGATASRPSPGCS